MEHKSSVSVAVHNELEYGDLCCPLICQERGRPALAGAADSTVQFNFAGD
jgi:hypothetical protein